MDGSSNMDDLLHSMRITGKKASELYYRAVVNRKDQHSLRNTAPIPSIQNGNVSELLFQDKTRYKTNARDFNQSRADSNDNIKRPDSTILKVPFAKELNKTCNINLTMTKIQELRDMISHECECYFASCPSSQLTAADRRHLRAFHKGVLPKQDGHCVKKSSLMNDFSLDCDCDHFPWRDPVGSPCSDLEQRVSKSSMSKHIPETYETNIKSKPSSLAGQEGIRIQVEKPPSEFPKEKQSMRPSYLGKRQSSVHFGADTEILYSETSGLYYDSLLDQLQKQLSVTQQISDKDMCPVFLNRTTPSRDSRGLDSGAVTFGLSDQTINAHCKSVQQSKDNVMDSEQREIISSPKCSGKIQACVSCTLKEASDTLKSKGDRESPNSYFNKASKSLKENYQACPSAMSIGVQITHPSNGEDPSWPISDCHCTKTSHKKGDVFGSAKRSSTTQPSNKESTVIEPTTGSKTFKSKQKLRTSYFDDSCSMPIQHHAHKTFSSTMSVEDQITHPSVEDSSMPKIDSSPIQSGNKKSEVIRSIKSGLTFQSEENRETDQEDDCSYMVHPHLHQKTFSSKVTMDDSRTLCNVNLSDLEQSKTKSNPKLSEKAEFSHSQSYTVKEAPYIQSHTSTEDGEMICSSPPPYHESSGSQDPTLLAANKPNLPPNETNQSVQKSFEAFSSKLSMGVQTSFPSLEKVVPMPILDSQTYQPSNKQSDIIKSTKESDATLPSNGQSDMIGSSKGSRTSRPKNKKSDNGSRKGSYATQTSNGQSDMIGSSKGSRTSQPNKRQSDIIMSSKRSFNCQPRNRQSDMIGSSKGSRTSQPKKKKSDNGSRKGSYINRSSKESYATPLPSNRQSEIIESSKEKYETHIIGSSKKIYETQPSNRRSDIIGSCKGSRTSQPGNKQSDIIRSIIVSQTAQSEEEVKFGQPDDCPCMFQEYQAHLPELSDSDISESTSNYCKKNKSSHHSNYTRCNISRHSMKPWLNYHTLCYGYCCECDYPTASCSCCHLPQSCHEDYCAENKSPEPVESPEPEVEPELSEPEPAEEVKSEWKLIESLSVEIEPEPEPEPDLECEPSPTPECSEPSSLEDPPVIVDPVGPCDCVNLCQDEARRECQIDCARCGEPCPPCQSDVEKNCFACNLSYSNKFPSPKTYQSFSGRQSWVSDAITRSNTWKDKKHFDGSMTVIVD